MVGGFSHLYHTGGHNHTYNWVFYLRRNKHIIDYFALRLRRVMNQKNKTVPLFCPCDLQTFSFFHARLPLFLFVWLRGTRRVGLCCRSSLPTPGSHSTCDVGSCWCGCSWSGECTRGCGSDQDDKQARMLTCIRLLISTFITLSLLPCHLFESM